MAATAGPDLGSTLSSATLTVTPAAAAAAASTHELHTLMTAGGGGGGDGAAEQGAVQEGGVRHPGLPLQEHVRFQEMCESYPITSILL